MGGISPFFSLNFMKKITLEQAQKYIPLDDDIVNRNIHKASYYTIGPHPDPEMAGNGWEKVTYYLSKRNDIYIGGEGVTSSNYGFRI